VRVQAPAGRHRFKFVLDITDRKAIEAALLEETRTLETLNRTGCRGRGRAGSGAPDPAHHRCRVELTGAQFGSYFHNEMDETGERLHLFTLSGAEREAFITMGTPTRHGVFGPTFRNEGVIRSAISWLIPAMGSSSLIAACQGHLPVRSYWPCRWSRARARCWEGLLFGHPEPDRFTERHERLIDRLAAQAAIATTTPASSRRAGAPTRRWKQT
jgi:hypothetical protein